jgi:GTP-binding protein
MGDHAAHGGFAITARPPVLPDGDGNGTDPGGGRDAGAPGDEVIAYGRWLFAQHCTFVLGIARADDVPAGELPEIAFAGRSNVGKSSLVNALTGRTTLARTSKTPGRTQQINFFDLGERLMLADLPGYGYAAASKAQVSAWTRLVRAYLRGRQPLRRVCVLIDARHGIKTSDTEAMVLLDEAAVPYQAVLTKADAVGKAALEGVIAQTAAALAKRPAAHPWVVATSARTGLGIDLLRGALATLARPKETD